jgi:hypothetical protein
MSMVDAVLLVLALVIVALIIPSRFDPAIRLREWLDRKE